MSSTNIHDKVGMENGKYCKNNSDDVILVKKRLNAHGKRFNLSKPLDATNPYCGSRTIAAIKDFQERVMKITPDGWVGPITAHGGATLKALLKNPPVKPAKKKYTIAPSVKAALTQATAKWPQRSTASDGTIGNAEHASRKSDHNPASDGQVHAFDLTHDPDHGVDCTVLAAHLISQKDKRFKYIIWNKHIFKARDWKWHKYHGKNGHTHHMHVSIYDTEDAETDTSEWWPAAEEKKDKPPAGKATGSAPPGQAVPGKPALLKK